MKHTFSLKTRLVRVMAAGSGRSRTLLVIVVEIRHRKTDFWPSSPLVTHVSPLFMLWPSGRTVTVICVAGPPARRRHAIHLKISGNCFLLVRWRHEKKTGYSETDTCSFGRAFFYVFMHGVRLTIGVRSFSLSTRQLLVNVRLIQHSPCQRSIDIAQLLKSSGLLAVAEISVLSRGFLVKSVKTHNRCEKTASWWRRSDQRRQMMTLHIPAQLETCTVLDQNGLNPAKSLEKWWEIRPNSDIFLQITSFLISNDTFRF